MDGEEVTSSSYDWYLSPVGVVLLDDLLISDRGRQRIIYAGAVSRGIGCARKNMPGVYTRIKSYQDWIKKVAKDDGSCRQT